MPTGFRFGTVGPSIPGIEVRTAGDGEVLVRGPNVFAGYYKDDEAAREVVDAEGWLHTGDVGHIEDGFLTITDRKKDIIITAGGKNVAPQNIENALKTSKYVSQALVIGDRRPYVTALITLDEAEIGKLDERADVQTLIQEVVDDVNRDKASFEQVKRFTILPRDFSAELDEVTPTLKLKRKVCAEHFAGEIDALSGRRSPSPPQSEPGLSPAKSTPSTAANPARRGSRAPAHRRPVPSRQAHMDTPQSARGVF